MKFNKHLAVLTTALAVSATLGGCATASNNEADKFETGVVEQLPENQLPPEINVPEDAPVVKPQPPEDVPVDKPQPPEEIPVAQTVSYISVMSDGVNIRTGAGTNYSSVAKAEKSTLYTYLGEENGWYKTKYRNKIVYISKKYCVVTQMDKSENERIEAVIAEGANFLGTPYVYGAVRLHDGKGTKLKGFTTNAFDCSSLMQYMFYKGADELLQVNTRTQVYQGTTVPKSKLRRGDLMFFTNASRKNNVGVERIGHVAMYLGDNYILHTASDYAKIEQISSTRWSYYIQTQRII